MYKAEKKKHSIFCGQFKNRFILFNLIKVIDFTMPMNQACPDLSKQAVI